MSYSGLAKAVLLSVGLSACAHGASQQTKASTPSTYAEAEAPRFKRLHSAVLAAEARRAEPARHGAVVADGIGCDPWSQEQLQKCDLSQLATESSAGGYRYQP